MTRVATRILPLGTLLTCIILSAGCAGTGHCGFLDKEIISTPGAPAAIGPYSQAVLTDDFLYLSGQIAIDPKTGKLVEGGIEVQTRQVLDNLGAVLKAADLGFENVVQVQVFLKDLDNYGTMNRIYAEYFTEDFPARAAMEVARLPKDVDVEIMAVAVRN